MENLDIHKFVSRTGAPLDKYDAAEANLFAALGLRGAEGLDIGCALAWIDEVAKRVQIETLRHSYKFSDDPFSYENSPAYFCMLVLATVMYQEFGVRYNPQRMKDPKFQDPNCLDPDFSDSRDLFIHGMINGPGGTCASMPVLKAAVGRRLGYPLRLVEAKGHLFLRWDDPNGEVWQPAALFNIEATREGLSCTNDEHYMQWPRPIDEVDMRCCGYMQSMTPSEEVALFRSTRAICLWENGRYADALREANLAVALAHHRQQYSWHVMDLYKKYRQIMATKTREELGTMALFTEEEHAIQHNIVLGHQERLRRGKQGYDLAEFGIFPKVIEGPKGTLISTENWTAAQHQAYIQRCRHLPERYHNL
jgi:hypothetical protein